MSWASSLFTGNSPQINSALSNTGQVASFSSGTGQSSTTKGTNWFGDILSGDPTKIATALAPAISAGQQGVQEQKNQIAQFGNRSGGSTAKANSLESENRGNITKAVAGLQSGAAGTLLSSGQSLLNTGLSGFNQQSQIAQQQMDDWSASLFGKGITGAAAAGESFALGKI